MQKILAIFAFSFLWFAASARSPKVLVDNHIDGVTVDAGSDIVTQYTILPCGDISPFSVGSVEVTYSRNILTTRVLTDSIQKFIFQIVKPDGTAVEFCESQIVANTPNINSVSLFKIPRSMVVHNDKSVEHRNGRIVLFVGGNSLMVCSSTTGGESWSELSPINSFGAGRISNLIPLRDGRIMALFSSDGRFIADGENSNGSSNSEIYKIYSLDGGASWGMPEIALKHNIHSLDDAIVVRTNRKSGYELIMVASDPKNNSAFVSFSTNEGDNWSYPTILPTNIVGDHFAATSYHGKLFITYRDMNQTLSDGSANPTYGDPILWSGNLKEFLNGSKRGVKMRIADNLSNAENDLSGEDRSSQESGYPTIISLSGNKLSITVSGRWDEESPPRLTNFVVDTHKLSKIKVK